jgi:hypothetical protein
VWASIDEADMLAPVYVYQTLSTHWVDLFHDRFLERFEVLEICKPGCVQDMVQAMVESYRPGMDSRALSEYADSFGDMLLYEASQAQERMPGLDLDTQVAMLLYSGDFYHFVYQLSEYIITVLSASISDSAVQIRMVNRPSLEWTQRLVLKVQLEGTSPCF